MIDSFKKVSLENYSPIAKAIGDFSSDFCDFTPFVMLMWQGFYNTEYSVINGALVLKHTVDGKDWYAILSDDITKTAKILLESGIASPLPLSLVSEKEALRLAEEFNVMEQGSDDGWSDYIYLHSDLSSFSGKRFSGQRNHINKFMSSVSSWSYEEINENNMVEVLEFYKKMSADTSDYNSTALYEREMLINYMSEGYKKLSMAGGIIRADGAVVAFSFGETVGDMLFVHTEKALKNVPGAYQMIVREFARRNPAQYINREEDMGLAGLRTSKLSYHPIRLAKKYKITLR